MADSNITLGSPKATEAGFIVAKTIPAERTMTMVLLQDFEAETLSSLNTAATIYISIASALITVAVSIGVGIALSDTWNDITKILGLVLGPLCLAVGIALAFLARHNLRSNSSHLETIKSQTRPLS